MQPHTWINIELEINDVLGKCVCALIPPLKNNYNVYNECVSKMSHVLGTHV